MAQTVTLMATTREKTGKGAARQARFNKQVPAVIYGHGRATQPLMVDALALEKALTGIEPESTLIELTVDGKKSRTLIREIQRHPIRPDIIHVDFYEIRGGEKITLKVPVHLVGTPDGVRNAGGGNPGPESAATRHNAGFLVADALAAHWQFPPFRRAERARATEGSIASTPVRILKPTTFMNRSGAALASLRADPTFTPERDLLILVDDFQIPLGTFRLRPDGSAGGHNGLKSIEGALQSQQYARLRIGVGPLPEGTGDWADYVLNAFEPAELEQVESLIPRMIEAVDGWLREGC